MAVTLNRGVILQKKLQNQCIIKFLYSLKSSMSFLPDAKPPASNA